MSELIYKTRNDISPQGMPRVYFTCHPEDFGVYFESITDDLLVRQNCAIFYTRPDAVIPDDAEYEMDLSQMQLLVVPITARMLNEPNRAMDFDIPFALTHHIPVLPLMQESGLDASFTKRFGELQYLDRNNTDSTAISYDEKLDKYLDSVIVGDELAAKIRAAFDAYIFLSYRKKDRKYAQKLMRMIHGNPLCRDIAIWYDEFLTPGENFSDAIKEALNKSCLFALTVTPNLINEKNYVMTTEYPMAQRLNKRVLPTEMVPTDKETLLQYYENLPEVIGCGESDKLSDILTTQLNGIELLKNDCDPQHKYLVGLAYLSGIDVEVDHDRAIELIASSAQGDFPDAYEKLVSMYVNGDGVAPDYKKALELQQMLTDIQGQRREAQPDEPGSYEYLKNLLKLGEVAQLAKEYALSQEYYARAFKVGDSYLEEYHTDRIYRIVYLSLKGLGENAAGKKDYAEAEDHYFAAMSRCKALLLSLDEPYVLRDMGDICLSIGYLYYDTKKWDDCRRYFSEGVNAFERVLQKTGDVRMRKRLIVCLMQLGYACYKIKEYPEAEKNWLTACGKAETIQNEDVYYNCLVCWVFRNLAMIPYDKKRYGDARDYLNEAVRFAEKVDNSLKVPYDLRVAASAYLMLSDIDMAYFRRKDAVNNTHKAIAVLEELARRRPTAPNLDGLYTEYSRVGKLEYQLTEFSASAEDYGRAARIALRLYDMTAQSDQLLYCGNSWYFSARSLHKGGYLAEAAENCLRAASIMEKLFGMTHSETSRGNLLIIYKKLCEIVESSDAENNAEEYRSRIRELEQTKADNP